jgi:hypothetical protein
MSPTGKCVETLVHFGYSSEEIAFLDMVTAHSGYFVPNQFLDFTGQKKGRALNEFTDKLIGLKHVSFHPYRNGARVYHVFSRKLYQALGRDNVRTRRKHALEYIRTRLVTLDFVLANANQPYKFLEGEVEKVSFLRNRFEIQTEDLPFRTYSNPRNSKSTVRYFVDRFPMFWASNGDAEQCFVTFTFIDSGLPTIQPFVTHLSSYKPLFSALKAFEFIYVAPTSRLFGHAETTFRRLLLSGEGRGSASDVLHYFQVRRAWETNEPVPGADVVFLKHSRRRFVGDESETLYKQWASGALSGDKLSATWSSRFSIPTVIFRTAIFGRSLAVFSRNMRERPEQESDPSCNGRSATSSGMSSGR